MKRFVVRRKSLYGESYAYLALRGPFAYQDWVGSPSEATPFTATEAAQWAVASRGVNRDEDCQPRSFPIERLIESIPPDTLPEGRRNPMASWCESDVGLPVR